MISELCVSSIVPSNIALVWPLLPSTGFPGANSPASSVLFAAPTSEHPFPPRSFKSLGGSPAMLFSSLLCLQCILSHRPGFLINRPPGRCFFGEMFGPPRFLGNPSCTCPALRPRQSFHTRYFGASVLLSAVLTASASASLFSYGAVSHGPYTCYPRFINTVTCTHAGLASGWLPALTRQGCLPAGFLLEVSVSCLFLLYQAYPGAPKLKTAGRTSRNQIRNPDIEIRNNLKIRKLKTDA
jgi:hypothetical protein